MRLLNEGVTWWGYLMREWLGEAISEGVTWWGFNTEGVTWWGYLLREWLGEATYWGSDLVCDEALHSFQFGLLLWVFDLTGVRLLYFLPSRAVLWFLQEEIIERYMWTNYLSIDRLIVQFIHSFLSPLLPEQVMDWLLPDWISPWLITFRMDWSWI